MSVISCIVQLGYNTTSNRREQLFPVGAVAPRVVFDSKYLFYILLSGKFWSKPKYLLNTILLTGGHIPLVVVILKDSFVLLRSNGTQQVPLGAFTQSAKI